MIEYTQEHDDNFTMKYYPGPTDEDESEIDDYLDAEEAAEEAEV